MWYPVLALLALLPLFSPISGDETFKVGVVVDQYLSYAASDKLIGQGITFWQDWVNAQGGLTYNGSSKLIQVFTTSASSADPNDTINKVTQAYEDFVTVNNVDLLVSPFSAGRTTAAISVSEKYGIINFVPASLLDSQFSKNNTYLFTAAMPSMKLPVAALKLLVAKGIKNYIMIRRPDAISLLLGANAIAYLNASGVAPLSILWLNTTTSDTQEITTSLRGVVSQATDGVSADVFIYAGMGTEFSIIASIFQQLSPDVKAAVLLTPLSRYEQANDQLGNVGDYWITTTRFDKDFAYGVSGQLGGTTAEFVQAYTAQFGSPPTTYDGWTPALLMAYYVAVQATGSVDHDVVRAKLKSMDTIQTFACPVKFLPNGTNQYSPLQTMQLIDGEGRIVTADNIIFPAPFKTRSKSLSTTTIVAIVVPVAVVVILLVAVGVYYMRRQHAEVVKALVQAEEGERRNYKIDYSALDVGTPIGTGGFGVVYKGEYRGAEVAIKKLKTKSWNKTQLEEFAKESAVMIGLRHPNILLFMGVCLEPPDLCIITEFMPRGSLFDIIHNDDIKLPFPLVRNMTLDILKGLHFIHSAGIIHRDLKSPNLLVDRSWNIKIADFGLSAMKAQADDDEAQISLLWTAPEILKKEPGCYSEKSDMYSFSIILWEILARQTPFQDYVAAAISPAVVNGKRPAIDPKWDETMTWLITAGWAPDPAARPSVKDARVMAEKIYADPSFEVGGSSSLSKYSEKAPPPTDNVTFVYTSVFHSAKLWEHDPHTMMRSLLIHNEIIRAVMLKYAGYEVKYNCDAFLIAFGDPVGAINFSLEVQAELLVASWPDILLRHVEAEEQKDISGKVIFRGLSLCLGIHATVTSCTRDANSGKVDYFSPEVGHASRYARLATRGCIAMGHDMYTKVMANAEKVEKFSMESIGRHIINEKEVSAYQMTSAPLKDRTSMQLDDLTPYGDTPGEVNTTGKVITGGTEKWLINFESIELREKIGAGSFGEVRLGIYKGKKVAVKQLLKQKLMDEALLELHVESAILSSLNHPNILSFTGMCLNLPNLCLVTEFMERGSLAQIMHGSAVCMLSWNQKMKMVRDIAQGMTYLHGRGIIHRDIKPSNMLVANDFTVKIADFGFSRMKADNQTMTQVGTVAYSAPEIFEGLRYTDKADVYSFAILLWELVVCKKPWDKMHSMKIVNTVTSGTRLPLTEMPLGVPPQLLSLMQACWHQDPASRPTFPAILSRLQ